MNTNKTKAARRVERPTFIIEYWGDVEDHIRAKLGLTAEGLNDSLTHPLLPELQAIFDRVLPRETTA